MVVMRMKTQRNKEEMKIYFMGVSTPQQGFFALPVPYFTEVEGTLGDLLELKPPCI